MRQSIRRVRTLLPVILLTVTTVMLAGCYDVTSPEESGDSSPYTLTVVNRTGSTMTQVYVSRCTSSTWGTNQLSSNIPPDGERPIDGIPGGCYDLKAITAGGGEAENLDVDITRDRRWIVY